MLQAFNKNGIENFNIDNKFVENSYMYYFKFIEYFNQL